MSTNAILVYNHFSPIRILGTFYISECFSDYDFMVIHNVEKTSAHGGAQKKESTPVERVIGSPLEEAWGHL